MDQWSILGRLLGITLSEMHASCLWKSSALELQDLGLSLPFCVAMGKSHPLSGL